MAFLTRKICIMGYRSVGKSSLTIQYVDGQFVDSYDPTIENTFTKKISFRGNDFDIQLVDTAGQDEYSIMPQSYFIDVHGYILVYSVTSKKSFDVVKLIHEKVIEMSSKSQVPIVLVGNKIDLHNDRAVSKEDGKKLANEWKVVFHESSARENQSVSDIFTTILFEIDKASGRYSEKKSCLVM